MRKILATGALLAALGGVAACGGGESTTNAASAADALAKLSSDDKAAVEAVSAKLDDGSAAVGDISAEQRDCVAVSLVKSLGAKRVLEVSGQDELALPQAEAEKAADAFLGCVDVAPLFAAGMSDAGEISQKSANCLAGKVTKDGYRKMLTAVFTGNEEDAEADLTATFLKAMGDCLTPDELGGFGR